MPLALYRPLGRCPSREQHHLVANIILVFMVSHRGEEGGRETLLEVLLGRALAHLDSRTHAVDDAPIGVPARREIVGETWNARHDGIPRVLIPLQQLLALFPDGHGDRGRRGRIPLAIPLSMPL